MQLGLEGVPVDFQDFESEADEWAHMVADNALAEMSAMAEDDLLELARGITDAALLIIAAVTLWIVLKR